MTKKNSVKFDNTTGKVIYTTEYEVEVNGGSSADVQEVKKRLKAELSQIYIEVKQRKRRADEIMKILAQL